MTDQPDGFLANGGWWVVGQLGLLALYALVLVTDYDSLPSPEQVAIGLAVALAGGLLVGRGMVKLGRNLTPVPQPVAGGTLIESGVYGRVRHPIYGGLVLLAGGGAVAFGSLAALIVAGALYVYFHFKSKAEEARLVALFPDYSDYRERVRSRLIPGLHLR